MPWNLLAAGTLNGLTAATRDAIIGNPPSRFYMTGDGHRHPPFRWATLPAVRIHFMEQQAAGQLCLHVELHQDEVTADSVPPMFNPASMAGKVFGWELSMFRDLLPVMNLIMEIMNTVPHPRMVDVARLDRDMVLMSSLAWKVGSPPWMMAAPGLSTPFRVYWNSVLRLAPAPVPRVAATEDAYQVFINTYNNNAMRLRTDANNFIAINIARSIALFPNDTHLITLGSAHLTTNPVQNFLNIGANIGIADASQN